jgi:hypothetical protein
VSAFVPWVCEQTGVGGECAAAPPLSAPGVVDQIAGMLHLLAVRLDQLLRQLAQAPCCCA